MSKVVLIAMTVTLFAASAQAEKQDLPAFMGHKITVIQPERDKDRIAKGSASICVDVLPQPQCYAAPPGFVRFPTVEIVQLQKNAPAILFSIATDGVSGWGIHFALLRLGAGKYLDNLFIADTSMSNQSQHAFWTESNISDTPIFVTADYISGPDEAHYDEHRFIMSAYVSKPSKLLNGRYYFLQDRFMTIRKYNLESGDEVLSPEKEEILARLRRVKASAENKE